MAVASVLPHQVGGPPQVAHHVARPPERRQAGEQRASGVGARVDQGSQQLGGAVEAATDDADADKIAALTDAEFDELFELLDPWAKAIVTSGGYPVDPSQLTRR